MFIPALSFFIFMADFSKKMSKGIFVRKIKLLQSIRPNKEWQVSSRALLLSQIKAQGGLSYQKVSAVEGLFVYTQTIVSEFYRYGISPFFCRPSHMVATFTVFFGSILFAVGIAQQSIPGDTLYGVKQATETARLSVISAEDRPQMEIELAEKRLQEFEAISQKNMSPQERETRVALLAEEFSKNLSDAASNLGHIRTAAEPKKAIKVATLVKKKVADYGKLLDERQDTFGGNHASMKKTVDTADNAALSVIVERGSMAGMPQTAVASHLEESIKQTQDLFEKVIIRIAALKEEQSRFALKVEEGKKTLDEAKESVQKGEFKVALEKISHSKEIVSSLEEKTMQQGESMKVKLVY